MQVDKNRDHRLNVGVIGAGAWGSALACASARAGHQTRIWGRSSVRVAEINQSQQNSSYLGDLKLDPKIIASDDLAAVCSVSEILLLVTPMQSLNNILQTIKSFGFDGRGFVCCSKGIDRETCLFSSDLVSDAFPDIPVAVLSGPSFATDVVQDLPTAVTVASGETEFTGWLVSSLSSGNFRCYASSDMVGVEIGGAFKNVLALAVGAARGMKLGASAEAALIARGFAEISRLATKIGARPETLAGLSGLGDIVLSCSSEQSRNFRFGMALGQNAQREGLPLAEGAFTASVALRLAEREAVDMPIVKAVVSVLDQRLTAREAVEELLRRPLKSE